MRWLYHYNQILSVASLILIAAGGLVTSTGSGLAVPDWPNTYGYFMFSFPLSKMVGGILYEHGHRLIASGVGLLTIGLAIGLSRFDSRLWISRLGWYALLVVITQGILGGITVLYLLPAPISITHGGLAQIFFVLIVSLAVFNSPGWHARYSRNSSSEQLLVNDIALQRLVIITPLVIYAQILVGATMRHTGAGLSIPDFPLAFGRLIPPMWDTGIAIHFSHRVGAIVTMVVTLATTGHILAHHRNKHELTRPSLLLILLLATQLTLGAWTVLSEKQILINTAHVATGALLLATAVVLGLRTHRNRFPDSQNQTLSVSNKTSPAIKSSALASNSKSEIGR
jgi:cytochrome c oxidase assembly protein subunit 15